MLTPALHTLGVIALLPVLAMSVPQGDPHRCAVVDGTGQCLIVAADPGRPGGPEDPHRSAAPGSKADRQPSRPTTATTRRPSMKVVARSVPLDGTVLVPRPGGRAGTVANPVAAAAPAVLAQRAISQLTLRPPSIEMSTTRGAFVGVPVWLWIDRGAQATGPAQAVAAAGGARVQATGRLIAVQWRLGPPGAQVDCAGPGTPWRGQAGASPDCGYVYQQRSLPERTGGTGRWTVTATSLWQVEWNGVTDGGPVAGQQTVPLTSTATLAVGEVQVLVDGGG